MSLHRHTYFCTQVFLFQPLQSKISGLPAYTKHLPLCFLFWSVEIQSLLRQVGNSTINSFHWKHSGCLTINYKATCLNFYKIACLCFGTVQLIFLINYNYTVFLSLFTPMLTSTSKNSCSISARQNVIMLSLILVLLSVTHCPAVPFNFKLALKLFSSISRNLTHPFLLKCVHVCVCVCRGQNRWLSVSPCILVYLDIIIINIIPYSMHKNEN